MKLFTTLRRSKIYLLSVLAVAGVMAGAAVAQQVCPTPPVPQLPLAPGAGSLQGIPVPLPKQLDTVVKDRAKAIALGKALFWDRQVGSDGYACASCHFHAGADNRTKNQLNPGLRSVPSDTTFSVLPGGGGGVNYQMKLSDFPLHRLTDVLDRDSSIVFTTNDVFSSQGTLGGTFVQFYGINNELCSLETDTMFHVSGKRTRRVEPRNTPTTINAAFQFRTFWDGRANNRFNGVNPFGRRDVNAKILVKPLSGPVMQETLDLENAALASQAVGPPGSDLEMACRNRSFKQIGRKMLNLIPRPLHGQKVDPTDSVLGPYADPTHGLKAPYTYTKLIQDAFHDKYWNAPGYASPDGYTMMEENFSLYWGLSILLYEATLVSDQSPFDGFVGVVEVTNGITNTVTQPNFGALTQQQFNGMTVFMGKGKCVACHKGPDFTGAGLNLQFAQTINQESVIERMVMGDKGVAIYDNGFYNIGVTPTNHDLGVGADDPFGHPLSFARQLKQLLAGEPIFDPFLVNPCMFEANPCVPATADQRDAVDGAMKTPGLRNVELTGPYMHNGGMATLEQVVEFYNRGGNRRGPISADTTGFNHQPQWANNPSNLDVDIQALNLTTQEKSDLVAFLKALTDDRVRCEKAPFDHPALANYQGHTLLDKNNDGKLDDIIVRLPEVGAGGLPAKGKACIKPFQETIPQ